MAMEGGTNLSLWECSSAHCLQWAGSFTCSQARKFEIGEKRARLECVLSRGSPVKSLAVNPPRFPSYTELVMERRPPKDAQLAEVWDRHRGTVNTAAEGKYCKMFFWESEERGTRVKGS